MRNKRGLPSTSALESQSKTFMNFIEKLKARLKQALVRFAERKTKEQAEGMAQEAQGIVESTKDLARRNPLGLAALVGLGTLLLWMMARRRASRLSSES